MNNSKTSISTILPKEVESAETFEYVRDLQLFPEELKSVECAMEKRRLEFATGRWCARRVFQKLGYPELAVPAGSHREPLWPTGMNGSITHCDGYCGAAISCSKHILSLGIDAELHTPLPAETLDLVVGLAERKALSSRGGKYIHWDKLIFSAKESIFKAWFPLNKTWLGFEDVRVEFSNQSNTFAAHIASERRNVGQVPLPVLYGQYEVMSPFIFTSVVISATR
jgi:4'-phosphopantetheinyl transferase EntD